MFVPNSTVSSRLLSIDEALDNMILRIQAQNGEENGWSQRQTIEPFTDLNGILRRGSVSVFQARGLVCLDLALTTALACARDKTPVLVLDLDDYEVDVAQRIALIFSGNPSLAPPRLQMDMNEAGAICSTLGELRGLPIRTSTDRHLSQAGLSSLLTSWIQEIPQSDSWKPNGLVVLNGGMGILDAPDCWLELIRTAYRFRIALLVIFKSNRRDEYRIAGDYADTWMRLDPIILENAGPPGLARYLPTLERCWLRPPTVYPPLSHDELRGKFQFS